MKTLFSVNQYYLVASGVYRVHSKNIHCNITDGNIWNITRDVYKKTRSSLFQITGDNIFFFILFEYSYLSAKITWFISPILIISFALNLSMKFQQITERLEKTTVTQMTKAFWNEIHNHYRIACKLTEKASEILSTMISVIIFYYLAFLCERIYRQFS
jgi:hypothetical protein